MKTRAFAACALLIAVSALGQTSPYAPVRPLPLGDVLLSLPTSHMSSAGTWEVRFSHRFNQSIDQGSFSDRVHALWGLDSNADVGIGLSYVPIRDLQLSLLRSNAMDDIEFGAKYQLFQQAPAIPFTAALRVGADWRTEKNLTDRSSLFAQALVSRQFGQRAEVFLMPTWVSDAGRQVTGTASTALFRNAFNVPIGAAVMIRPGMSLVGEFIPKNHDLPRGMHADFGWSAGLKTVIGGHFFELLLTDTNATHADQYVTSTYQGTPLNKSDIHIGFNIERRFGK